MDKETTDLIERLCRQEGAAQRRMLQAYGDMVFGQVSRIVTTQEDAEEVYQDVFIKAFRSIGSYDSRKASLAVWLSRIAYNESLNFVRRSKPPVVYMDENKVNADGMCGAWQHNEQTIEMLERAMDHLSPQEQALITMFYFDDMSIKDIAYVTGSGPSTIGSQLCRTRKKIYQIMKSWQQ